MASEGRRSTKFYRQNEAEVMKGLGLVPTKNSGAGWVEKEDGQNDYLIAQLKSTDAESLRIQIKDWHTLEYNAAVAHKIPVFVGQFLSTGEVFIMAKPTDLPSVVQYLECGRCDIIKTEVAAPDEQIEENTKIIRSGNRGKFWKEKEKERSKWPKKSK
ncbi:MAG: hypothetical protein N3B21_19440 [Clostridia bacterium]|nr:hypothetical protein [Clostridia bacterium]